MTSRYIINSDVEFAKSSDLFEYKGYFQNILSPQDPNFISSRQQHREMRSLGHVVALFKDKHFMTPVTWIF